MIYAVGRRGATEGGRGCLRWLAAHLPAITGSCAARGDLAEILAPSGPEGVTFEGPDGAGLAWELVVGLPSG